MLHSLQSRFIPTLGTYFVGEDEVFDFICVLDAKIEVNVDFDDAESVSCTSLIGREI